MLKKKSAIGNRNLKNNFCRIERKWDQVNRDNQEYLDILGKAATKTKPEVEGKIRTIDLGNKEL